MHYSAKRGTAIAYRPSGRPSVTLVDQESHGLEILEPNTFALRSPKAIYLLPGQHEEVLSRLEVGWGKVVCWSTKAEIISEKRNDRGTVTMEGL